MAKVVTPFKLSQDRLAEIQQTGSEVTFSAPAKLDDIKLPEPAFGETTIGTLDAEETELFQLYYQLQVDIEDMHRTALGDLLGRLGSQIKASDRQKALHEAVNPSSLEFGDEETEKRYCRMQQLSAHTHATLFFQIGERLNCHEWKLGIRSKGRIVKTERRLKAMAGENG